MSIKSSFEYAVIETSPEVLLSVTLSATVTTEVALFTITPTVPPTAVPEAAPETEAEMNSSHMSFSVPISTSPEAETVLPSPTLAFVVLSVAMTLSAPPTVAVELALVLTAPAKVMTIMSA